MMNGYGSSSGYNMMNGYGVFNGYGFMIIIIFIFIAIYALVKLFSNNDNGSENHSLDILKNKLVQGEISEDEYLRKKEIIQSK